VVFLGFAIVLIFASILARLILDAHLLARLNASFGESKPNTVVGFLLLTAALILVDDSRRPLRVLSRVCALCAALLGTLTGLEYLTGWNPGLDQLFFSASMMAGGLHPSRMNPITALNLILLGASVLLLDSYWEALPTTSIRC
jgi:hypothetical protein